MLHTEICSLISQSDVVPTVVVVNFHFRQKPPQITSENIRLQWPDHSPLVTTKETQT